MDRHRAINREWGLFSFVFAARQSVDKPQVKALAALAVGATSFLAVYFDSRILKLVATGLGTILPATFLLLLYVGEPLMARRTNKAIEDLKPK